ncbi:unnamed protein product [Owenia fusiformis]|uniref:Uncharacterized protein n=1 Tax=Owenia fusiformis TaxID=6347 RepID=A0A8S4PBA1_OWEFU|nr:unnamed protein product [Owenia fusiformis]
MKNGESMKSGHTDAVTLLQILGIICVNLTLIQCHPQCLDFRPPFQQEKLSPFCANYKEFGCCTGSKDRQIQEQYEETVKKLKAENLHHCNQYLEDILCQACSPYAAHSYASESNPNAPPRELPGLCRTYCNDFYNACKDIVKHITNSSIILQSLSSADQFCEFNAIPDVDYCFPELLSNPILTKKVTNNATTVKGCLCLEEFASELRQPLLMRHANDDTERIFIGKQLGLVYIFYKNKTKIEEPFLNITEIVLTTSREGDERGFLGMTFHPNYTTNRKLYIFYSTKSKGGDHTTVISEMLVQANNPNKVDANSERIILKIEQPNWNHNGGEILFGDDGYLYLFIGDGGGSGDRDDNAQNKFSLLGKVLRINIDTRDPNIPYTIPADNPFIRDNLARPEIYAYGIRNIWRCGKDRGEKGTGVNKGRIICGDVGQDAYEEIDIIEPGGNFGWNSREGFECFRDDLCGKIEVLPIHAYPHSMGKSVTGGHIYRGCQNPNLEGMYIYGDFVTGRIWKMIEDPTTGQWDNSEVTMCGPDVCFNGLVGTYEPNILSFGEDQDGELYILTTDFASSTSASGKVYKIVDPIRRGDPESCGGGPVTWKPTPTTTDFQCDFEKGTCGLKFDNISPSGKQLPIDGFHWQRHKGATRTEGTGPEGDHTKTDASGYYLYTEASSPAVQDDVARAIVQLNLPTPSKGSLDFYYHAFGENIAAFRVYSQQGSLIDILLAVVGAQDNTQWRYAKFPLEASVSNLEIVFEVVRGASWKGDIAIDDITITFQDDSSDKSTTRKSPPITTKPTITDVYIAGEHWRAYPGQYLPGYNDVTEYRLSLEDCLKLCVEISSMNCQSVDYVTSHNECILADTNQHDPRLRSGLGNHDDITYYERLQSGPTTTTPIPPENPSAVPPTMYHNVQLTVNNALSGSAAQELTVITSCYYTATTGTVDLGQEETDFNGEIQYRIPIKAGEGISCKLQLSSGAFFRDRGEHCVFPYIEVLVEMADDKTPLFDSLAIVMSTYGYTVYTTA